MEKIKCPGCGSPDAIEEYDDHPYGEGYAREYHGISCECGYFPFCYVCGEYYAMPDGHNDAKHAAIRAEETVQFINEGIVLAPTAFEVIGADILCPPG